MVRCPATVWWHDVEFTARCLRPAGHTGAHRDGVHWFDDLGIIQPQDQRRPRVTRPRADLSREQVLEIRRRHDAGETTTSIALALGLTYQTVYACARRLTYRAVA
jgi:hypothetical protein